METLDAGSRQSAGLPSINHLDSEKIKREEVEYQRKHSAPAMVSPSYSFPGPSHVFSNHQSSSASAVGGTLGGLLSPPESCRTSDNEKDVNARPAARLPSIHEALGGSEQPLPYPPPPSSAPLSAAPPYHPSSATTSPSDQRARTYSVDVHAQGPSNPYAHPRSPYMNPPSSTPTTAAAPVAPPPPHPPHTHPEPLPRSTFPPVQHNPKLPSLHPIRTTQSPPPNAARPNIPYSGYTPQTRSAYEPGPHSAGSMNPHYGYSGYPPQYPLSAPAPGGPPPVYPPTFSAPAQFPPPQWRSEGSELNRAEEPKKPYGENVKRHLDSFDFEASLNEMAEGAGRIMDFSKIYRQKAHENSRIGLTPSAMPRLEEVDDMIKQGEKIQASLQRMREVVFNQQQVNVAEQKQDPRYRPINGYDESPNSYHDEPKGAGGFNGSDPKKRRGRAAPPGRCHSCNRAETPEWRRGPDGARTLCNACGLHYAKLTRKMGTNKAIGSSNIRPKTLGGEGASAA